MLNARDLVRLVKQAALDAVANGKPSGVYFGTVEGVSPLKIRLEQKMLLGPAQLILARNVTDHKTWITVDPKDHHTTMVQPCSIPPHKHDFEGKKEVTIHNALRTGEKVMLIREQGGQRFIVTDRVTGL